MLQDQKPSLEPALFHPVYWPTWMLFGLWWFIAQLPYRLQLLFGEALGVVFYHLLRRRRWIARRNLELCFPQLNQIELERLLRANFKSTTIAFFETGIAWFCPRKRLSKLVQVEGLEHLQSHLDQGRGVLLLSLHFTTIEMLGVCINSLIDTTDMTYRPHTNPVYDYIQSRQRARHNPSCTVVARGDVRAMVRSLKKGRCISYFPDQDYGRKHSVFAPFFGIPAATVTAMPRLIKMTKVPVIPLVNTRLPDGKGYLIKILPAWKNYPTDNEQVNARRLNEHIEAQIRQQPDQYLWVHRRFKTRPSGEKDVYGLPKRSRRRKRRTPNSVTEP